MPWTPITKPSGTTYVNVNAPGREQYDQYDIEYDSSTTYYDGINPAQYTNIAKPSGTTWTNIAKPS